MLYVVSPFTAQHWGHLHYFMSYSAAESLVIQTAKVLEREGHDPDWCTIIGLDGTDELHPVFVYKLVGSAYLRRERWITPSP
jgi:hypothetical protein